MLGSIARRPKEPLEPMQIDELIRAAATEPNREVTRSVRVCSPATLEAVPKTGISVLDLSSLPAQVERKTFRFGHLLGPPASPRALEEVVRRAPLCFPADLMNLVARVNGIHLWADLDRGRSYTGLAPIEEWDVGGVALFYDALDDRHVSLTYHDDGAAAIVLELTSGTYYLMDTAGADHSCQIGKSSGDLLDYLWTHRIPPPDTST
jgi:hypothetical protein